jgi:hypothetical protein
VHRSLCSAVRCQIARPAATGVGRLSTGGMETSTITPRNLDLFTHTGLFSGGSIRPEDIANMDAFKKSNELVFASHGSREVQGSRTRRCGEPEADVNALKAAGINSHNYIPPNTAHEWHHGAAAWTYFVSQAHR